MINKKVLDMRDHKTREILHNSKGIYHPIPGDHAVRREIKYKVLVNAMNEVKKR